VCLERVAKWKILEIRGRVRPVTTHVRLKFVD
jgi:hypothetical protein